MKEENILQRDNDYILECEHLFKSFGGTHALSDVQLHVKKGEVHALVGENGAGKSTLMKIVIGLYKADSGTITFEGKPYEINGPAEAIQRGISMVHQELNPEPHMTVAENIFLNREDTKGIILNKKKTNQKAQELLKLYNLDISPTMLVEGLTLAKAQMLEIIKAVSCGARLVIMDEPTSSLDNEETDALFNTIRKLKKDGISVIYISHRMEEIFDICDTVSVFRDGHFIDMKPISEVSPQSLIKMMTGRDISNVYPKDNTEIGDEEFRVENLTGDGFNNISFSVKKGEILGLTGLAGAGRSETAMAIFGLNQLKSGKILLEGKEIHIKNPRSAIDQGIAMVNEDRRKYGLCLYRSINENISLPNLKANHKGLFINKRRERKDSRLFAKMLTVKAASLDADAISLSGGNQQKVVLAKWMMTNPKVLIMDEPTRGVDVGAKFEIYNIMNKLAKQGLAIIMISSELPEVMGMSDRILVYHEGKINGEFTHKEIAEGHITQETILTREFGEETIEE